MNKAKQNDCDHMVTVGREGETGSFCIKCGIKVLEEETRKCSNCKHYKKLHDGSICTKKLMSLIPDMFVTYKVDEGTCFEQPDIIKTDQPIT